MSYGDSIVVVIVISPVPSAALSYRGLSLSTPLWSKYAPSLCSNPAHAATHSTRTPFNTHRSNLAHPESSTTK